MLIAPAPDAAVEDPVVLRGMAYAGKRLGGQGYLALAAFDSAFTLDLERVYAMIAGLFDHEECTWGDFLEGWQGLFSEVVLRVRMCTGRYPSAFVLTIGMTGMPVAPPVVPPASLPRR